MNDCGQKNLKKLKKKKIPLELYTHLLCWFFKHFKESILICNHGSQKYEKFEELWIIFLVLS
jgi:hypothetical protein